MVRNVRAVAGNRTDLLARLHLLLGGQVQLDQQAAVVSLTKSVATQYGPQNIRCNTIAPGAVVTPA